MRTFVGTFIGLAALASVAFAGTESNAPLPVYHLRGYYAISLDTGIWQFSDNAPWQVVKNEPWIDPQLVKWGYVPLTHDSQHYYCMIDNKPITGSNISEPTFICGSPATVKLGYVNMWRPKLLLYGGGR